MPPFLKFPQTLKKTRQISVILPNGNVAKIWDQIKLTLLVYTIWSFPFHAIFDTRITWLRVFPDSLFLIDMVKNFFTAFYDDEDHKIVTDLRLIAKRYCRLEKILDRSMGYSFYFDFLSLAPYYITKAIIPSISLSADMNALALGLSLLPQCERFVSISFYFRTMELSVNSDARKVALSKFFIMLLGSAHWIGCSWWVFAKAFNFDETTWVYRYFEFFLKPVDNSTTDLLQKFGFKDCWSQYEISLYWGFQALTNLGYSDILPDNTYEMIYAYLLCMAQVGFYAYVLGNSTLFSVLKRDESTDLYRKKMNSIDVYGSSHKLPNDLQARLKGYFDFQSKKVNGEEISVLKKLPSMILDKVAFHKNGDLIVRCSIFEYPPPQFITSIVSFLKYKYLMPRERLFKKADMSREVCFVQKGSLEVYGDEEAKTFINAVKNDNVSASIVGELSFFLVIPQPHMVMASAESDVTVLTLSKHDYGEALKQYPESHQLIVTSLLAEMGLDPNGEELKTTDNDPNKVGGNANANTKEKKKKGGGGADESDEAFAELKNTVRDALKKRIATALYEMMYAAREGDSDKVVAMLNRGLDINACDYDKRTTLHLAAAEGNLKSAECLINEGANVHALDRYGKNPLHYAVTNNHATIADLLSRNGSELNYTSPADYLCAAAGSGNMDRIRVLVKHGVDVNSSDYDGRSALHLASAEGNLRVVELLLSMEADVNKHDRWGHTPLDGAVEKGHDLVAAALFARGGELNMSTAKGAFMTAARKGDLAKLKLFVENGIDVDVVDYDSHAALHVAAIADQPVAVDFLLSAKANVNCRSRWGTTPLDEAISSESVYCSKLLAACGGKAYAHAMSDFAKTVAESPITLEEIRVKINEEVITQSKRSRASHKLKQLHAKLMEDVQSSCETLARQCHSIESAVSKLGSSRLTTANNQESFVEDYLEFRTEDGGGGESNLLPFSTSGADRMDSGMKNSDDGERDNFGRPSNFDGGSDHFMLQRFMNTSQQRTSLPNTAEVSAKTDEPSGERLISMLTPSSDVSAGGVASSLLSQNVTFSSFNQVMLSLAKMETGFSEFREIFDSFAEGSANNTVGIDDLERIFLTSGINVTDSVLQDIIAQGNLKTGKTENEGPMDIQGEGKIGEERKQNTETGDSSTNHNYGQEDQVSFTNILSSSATLDAFTYEGNFKNNRVNKIGMAFKYAQATFNLLDIERDGRINLRNLRRNEQIIGELSHGEELFQSFGHAEDIYPSDMVVLLATWVNCVDDDGKKDAEGDDYDSGSMDMNEDDPRSETKSEVGEANGRGEGISSQKSDLSNKSLCSRLLHKFGLLKPRRSLEEELLIRLSTDFADSVEGIFSAYDADNSGAIDREEFTEMLRHLFGNISKADIDNLFDIFDVDKTGQLFKSLFQKKLVAYRDGLDEKGNDTTDKDDKDTSNNNLGGTPSSALMFDAEKSTVVKYVKMITTFTSFYYFLFVPYEICFIHTDKGDTDSFSFLIIGWVFDLTLWVDIFVNFHTTYISRKSVRVTDAVKIRKHYLAHGFTSDFITAFPMDFITRLSIGAKYSTIRWFRLTRLLRIANIVDYFRAKRHNSSQAQRIKVELWIFTFLLFALTHLPACLWFFLTDHDDEDTFLHNTKIVTSEDGYWFSGYGVVSSNGIKFEQYLMSLYWVTGTISTMGQGAGELMPQNEKERIFTIFLMLLNLSAYAYILGAISQLFMTADEALVDIRKEVTLIESYIGNNDFGPNLISEIRGTVKMSNALVGGKKGTVGTISTEEEREIIKSLSHNLRVEVAHHTCYHLLKMVRAFENCNTNFMDSISTCLKEEIFKPGSYVFKTNEPSVSYYLIGSGSVEILNDDAFNDEQNLSGMEDGGADGSATTKKSNSSKKLGGTADEKRKNSTGGDSGLGEIEKELVEGDVMGEIPFFFDTRHTNAARAGKSFVKLWVLEKKDYKQILELYPDEEEQIGKNVLKTSSLQFNQKDPNGNGSEAASSSGGSEASSSHDAKSDYSGTSSQDTTDTHNRDSKLSDIARAVEKARKKESNERVFAMCTAASKGNLTELKKLCLDDGVSLDSQGYAGRTPLHLAASEGHLDTVKWICKQMQDINIKDANEESALMSAIENEHDDLAKYLRSLGATLDTNFAAKAVSEGAMTNNVKKLRLLFDLGADPNINVAGRVRGGARRRRSALHFAASGGHVETVQVLIDNWANLNPYDGWEGTPLADCIRHKHVQVQKILRERGAKLKEKGLNTAAAKGDLETLKIMVMNGVDINIGNYIGRTMLHLACSNKQLNVIDYLLKLPGINPNVVDWYAGTPTEDAHRGNHESVCVTMREVAGVRAGHPSLEADVLNIKKEREAEKAKFWKAREADKERDKKRLTMLEQLSYLTKVAMEDIVDVRRLLDALGMSLAQKSWKKQEAIDKAPNMELEDIMKYFTVPFQKFMARKHSLKQLKFYQFLIGFRFYVESNMRGTDEMIRIAQDEYDKYLDPVSPDYIAINPDKSSIVRVLLFGEEDIEDTGALKKLLAAFKNIEEDMAGTLETKFLGEFYRGTEFGSLARSVTGRTWRVLKMCKKSRDICKRLEQEVAVPMQEIVRDDKMKGMYGGSSQFNLTMKEVSVEFQQKLLDTIERIEAACIVMNSIYDKNTKKQSMLTAGVKTDKHGKAIPGAKRKISRRGSKLGMDSNGPTPDSSNDGTPRNPRDMLKRRGSMMQVVG